MTRNIPKSIEHRLPLALACLAALGTGPVLSQDTVVTRNADGVQVQRSGLIVDVNADRVLLKVGEREQKIPYRQVIELRSSLDPMAATGDQLFAERKFELAFEAYGKHLNVSTPAWMRRRLLAGRVQSAVQMQSWSQAVDEFLALVQSDPQTQYFGVIPLAWNSARPDAALAQKIPAWLGSNNRLLHLIAASHGLTDRNRDAALKVLENLSNDEDPRIAALAKAQAWRAMAKLDPATLARCSEQLDAMPEDLRAGPCFVLGNAWAQTEPEKAVLLLLRVPVLFGDQFDLSAQALLQSADLLQKLNRSAEARIVLEEVLQRHAATTEADIAGEKIKQLANPSKQPQP